MNENTNNLTVQRKNPDENNIIYQTNSCSSLLLKKIIQHKFIYFFLHFPHATPQWAFGIKRQINWYNFKE